MARRKGNIELLILVSDFMVNSILKILKGISVECMEILNKDMKKKQKEDRSCDDQIATSPKLLDLMDSMLI